MSFYTSHMIFKCIYHYFSLQFLWHFKLNLTRGDQFLEAAEKLCAEELQSLDECRQITTQVKGHKLSCLLENSDSIGQGSYHQHSQVS